MIVALCVPTTAEASATLATIEPVPVPDTALSVNQLALLRAVQLPFAFTVTAWLVGLVPPCIPVKVNDEGLSATVGNGAETVSAMGMETGDALSALTVTTALYVPAANEPGVAVIVIVPLPVPEIGETLTQEAFSLADHVRRPPPPFDTLMVRELELLSPDSAAKERLVGLVRIRGGTGAAATVRLTGIVTGVAPAALRVIAVVYVPLAREPAVAVNTIVPVLLPEGCPSISHAAGAVAFQLNVPPPIFVTVRLCIAELASPC